MQAMLSGQSAASAETEAKAAVGPTRQIITFQLGAEAFGLPIEHIREVVMTPAVSKVPLTPSFVRGVANIRGNVLAIVDLEDRFGLDSTLPEQPPYTLVVESEAFKLGVLVSQVPNTLAVPESSIDHSPALFQQDEDRDYLEGIVKIDERLILLIDLSRVITRKHLQPALRTNAAETGESPPAEDPA